MKEESVELICKFFWVCKLCICLLRFCVHLYVIRLGVLVGVLFLLLLSVVCLVFMFFFLFPCMGCLVVKINMIFWDHGGS